MKIRWGADLLALVALGATLAPAVSLAQPSRLPGYREEETDTLPRWRTLTHDQWDGAAVLTDLFVGYGAYGLELGAPGEVGRSARFTSASAVSAFLPSNGAFPAPLAEDLVDPLAPHSLLGHVLVLRLNVDAADLEFISSARAGARFGDLKLCAFSDFVLLNNLSVRQFLNQINAGLGGDQTPYTTAQLASVAFWLNQAYTDGRASEWARAHLQQRRCDS